MIILNLSQDKKIKTMYHEVVLNFIVNKNSFLTKYFKKYR